MKHIKQIDGLRFIAVFLVLIEHFALVIGKYISAGYYGVDLFFVISGYLITSILINTREPFFTAYKKFLGRRTLRIFPLYYFVVLVLYLMHHPYVHQYIFYFLTYTYNYAWISFNIPPNSASPFWSLSVEEQFYLFWPFLILLLRKNEKWLTAIVTIIVVACFIQITFEVVGWLNPYNWLGSIPRAGSLGLGALGAVLSFRNLLPKKILTNKIVEYFVLVLLGVSLIINHNIKYPLMAVCSIFLVLKAANDSFQIPIFNSFLLNKKVAYIGSISYGIYIFHRPMGTYINDYFFYPLWAKIDFASWGKLAIMKYNLWLITFPLYTILSIILAHFSFTYFEKPILKLKDKLFGYK